MSKSKTLSSVLIASLLLTLTACGKAADNNEITIKEPGKSITVIDKSDKVEAPAVGVVRMDQHEKINIYEWFDKETVIVSKQNESLGKMSLAELSDSYPNSLYFYNINTKEYKLIKEQKNVNLGEAKLSADKKHLIYSEYTLGDPAYVVMNLNTGKVFRLSGEKIAGAMSAKWAGNEVIGAAYAGGAFIASTDGEIRMIEGLEGEAVFLVDKVEDKVYYNTNADETLWMLDLSTKEKVSLNIDNTFDIIPSPEYNQLLVLHREGSKEKLILCDLDGGNTLTIAEGTELSGVSWSPDQRMIAYNAKADVNGTSAKGLYIYDLLTGKSTQLVVDTERPFTAWSPTGEELSYSEWQGSEWNSSILYLN